MNKLNRELDAARNLRHDLDRLGRLIERLTYWEIRQMEAMDKLAAAFERHEAELREVKEGLKRVVEVIKEVPADTKEIEAQISAFADRLDGSTADMDEALKARDVPTEVTPVVTEEPVVESVVEPTPDSEVPTEVNPEPAVVEEPKAEEPNIEPFVEPVVE